MVPPPDKQYGLSKTEQDLILRRAQMKDALKREFRREMSNPHIRSPDGGYIFDPAVQRYLSMRATLIDQFKPTMKNFAVYMCICILPIGGLSWHFYTSRKNFEQKCRNGEIAYADRVAKFR